MESLAGLTIAFDRHEKGLSLGRGIGSSPKMKHIHVVGHLLIHGAARLIRQDARAFDAASRGRKQSRLMSQAMKRADKPVDHALGASVLGGRDHGVVAKSDVHPNQAPYASGPASPARCASQET